MSVNKSRRPARRTRCEKCNRLAYSQVKDRSICRTCYRDEPTAQCARCSRSSHCIVPNTNICARCEPVARRPLVPVPVICPQCRRLRVPALISSKLCHSCWRNGLNGCATCRGCGKYKMIYIKRATLCAPCYKNSIASQALRKYAAEYACPFSFNRRLFLQLIATLNWNQIRERDNRRLRYLGRFLQQHKLTAPLSWEQIFALMPPLPPTQRNIPKSVRTGLLDIGHMCAERGELEPYQHYIARRNALTPIAQAPQPLQPLLRSFYLWLVSRQAKLTTIHHHLEANSHFWRWCIRRKTNHPQQVSPSLINAYLLGLYWQWRCSKCAATAYCAHELEKAPARCPQCQRPRSLRRTPRYAQNHIRRIRASLFIFFEWAVLAKRAMINPVQRKVAAPQPKIEHYAPEVLRHICQFIVDPNADPTAALLLYFIVFHLTTAHELRHLRIPTAISLDSKRISTTLSASRFLLLPKRQASLGITHPGRPEGRLDFHPQAQSWLQPLLERYEAQRATILGERGKSQYLFVSLRSSIRNAPVSHLWVWTRVKLITHSILGYPCDPSTLRKTAAIYFADRVGSGVLSRMGWDPQQAFAYTWMPRLLRQPTPHS